MEHPIRLGIKYSGQDCTVDQLKAIWTAVDDAGFDHLWVFDHLVSLGPRGPKAPVFEGWTLLAAAAMHTRRVRIGQNVTANTFRNPAMLAKIAVTVDHLSGGRLEFGIGAAWNELEHKMFDIPGLDHRVGRLSEALRIITGLFTQDEVSFAGRYYTVTEAISNPKPVQKPYPPIWIGAGGEKMMKLVARYADVWNPSGPAGNDVQEARRVSEQLDRDCQALGRDPAAIRRSAQMFFDGSDPAKAVDLFGEYARIGFSEFFLTLTGSDPEKAVDAAATVILPQVRSVQR